MCFKVTIPVFCIKNCTTVHFVRFYMTFLCFSSLPYPRDGPAQAAHPVAAIFRQHFLANRSWKWHSVWYEYQSLLHCSLSLWACVCGSLSLHHSFSLFFFGLIKMLLWTFTTSKTTPFSNKAMNKKCNLLSLSHPIIKLALSVSPRVSVSAYLSLLLLSSPSLFQKPLC